MRPKGDFGNNTGTHREGIPLLKKQKFKLTDFCPDTALLLCDHLSKKMSWPYTITKTHKHLGLESTAVKVYALRAAIPCSTSSTTCPQVSQE